MSPDAYRTSRHRTSRHRTSRHRGGRRHLALVLALLAPLAAVLGLAPAPRAAAQAAPTNWTGIAFVGTDEGLKKVHGPSGAILLVVPGVVSPDQVAADPRNEVVWAHTDGSLHALDFDGGPLFTVPVPAGAAAGLEIATTGDLWLALDSTLHHYDLAGQSLGSFAVGDPVTAIHLDPTYDGSLWVIAGGNLRRFEAFAGAFSVTASLPKGKATLHDLEVCGSFVWLASSKGVTAVYSSSGDVAKDGWLPAAGAIQVGCGVAASPTTVYTYDTSLYSPTINATPSPLPGALEHLKYPRDWGIPWIAGGGTVTRWGEPESPFPVGPQVTSLGPVQRDDLRPELRIEGQTSGQLGFIAPLASLDVQWSDPEPNFSTWWPPATGVDVDSFVLDRWIDSGPPGSPFATCDGDASGATCQTTDPFLDGEEYHIRGVIQDLAGNSQSVTVRAVVDATPPTVSVDDPPPSAVLEDAQSPVTVTASDALSGIDWTTLEIRANGSTLPSDCVVTAPGSVCTPTAPMPVGDVTLEAAVADVAGQVGVSPGVDVFVSGEDVTPPQVAFTRPLPGATYPDPRPGLVLAVSDSGGSGLDPASLSVLHDDVELPRTCSTAGDEITCEPSTDFAPGAVTLTATIRDTAGNTSAPTQVDFTVVPDWTDVSGRVVDGDGLPLAGATVQVPGKPAAVTTSSADGSFLLSAVALTTGESVSVSAEITLGGELLAGRVSGLTPIYGGVTDAGTVTLVPLCDLRFSRRFEVHPGLGDLVACTGGCRVTARAVESYDDGGGATLYVAFNAGSAATVQHGVARYDDLGWQLVGTFDDFVHTLVVFDDGGGEALYAGGQFSAADGAAASRVARYRAGSWSPVGAGLAVYNVGELIVADTTGRAELHAAGKAVTSPAQGFVSRWDGAAWAAVGGTFDDGVNALAQVDLGAGPVLYAGGSFTTADGAAAARLARWNGSAWEAPPGGDVTSGTVLDLAAFDDGFGPKLAVAGSFVAVGGGSLAAARLALWDGGGWSALGREDTFLPATWVEALAVYDDGTGATLYAAGAVDRIRIPNGAGTFDLTVRGVVRWDGSAWQPLLESEEAPPGVGDGNGQVLDLLVASSMTAGPDRLLIAGRFRSSGDAVNDGLAEWSRQCDTSPPGIVVDSPAPPPATGQASITLGGHLSEPASLSVDGVAVTVAPDLSFVTPPLALAAGSNELVFVAFDAAGNSLVLPVEVWRDGTPPAVSITRPPAGATVTSPRPPIAVAYGDAGVGVDLSSLTFTLDGAPLAVDCARGAEAADCRPLADLPAGSHGLAARVTDSAGNPASTAVTFTVDTSTPTTTTVAGLVSLPGGGPAAGARVTVAGHAGATAVSAADGSFSVAGVEPAAGELLTIEARLSDATGAIAGAVSGVAPVVGGVTQAGSIQLRNLCAPVLDDSLFHGVGIDEIAFDEFGGGADTNFNPRVRAALAFDDGSGPALYVGGEFTTAGGRAANNIARWDGSRWSALGSSVAGGGVDDEVRALAVFDDGSGPALYAAGAFRNANGSPASRVARWDGSAWSDLGAAVPFGAVQALAVVDLGGGPALYAAGRFAEIGGVSATNVARWDGTSWSALGSGVGVAGSNDIVYALAVHDAPKGNGQALYAGGLFATAGGREARKMAVWDGAKWADLDGGLEVGDPNAVRYVTTLTVYRGDLYAGGWFTTAGSGDLPVDSVARWDGRNWHDVGTLNVNHFTGLRSGVLALFGYDDGSGEALYATGSLYAPDWQTTGRGVARWDGTSWSGVGGGFTDGEGFHGSAFTVFDEGDGPRLFAGHGYSRAGGRPANGVSRWDGNAWSSVPQGVAEGVQGLVAFDDGTGPSLYVAGYGNTKLEGANLSPLRWNGEEWAYLPQADPAAYLTVLDGPAGPELYAMGGSSGTYGPWSAPGIARWSAAGWVPLPAGLDGSVVAVTRFQGDLVVAGDFTVYGSDSQSVARLAGGRWEALDLGEFASGSAAFDLVAFDDGGGEKLYLASNRSTVLRWDGGGWEALGAFTDSYAVPRVVDLQVFDLGSGPQLFAGGRFEAIDGRSVHHIALWDGAAWVEPQGGSLSPNTNTSVSLLAVHDDGTGPSLYAAGNDLFFGRDLVRWDGERWFQVPVDFGNAAIGALTSFDDGSGPALYVGLFYGFNSNTSDRIDYVRRYRRPATCGGGGPDSTPPSLGFDSPQPGETLYSATPVLELSYADAGSGVDPSSLALTADGTPLSVTCDLGLSAATCQVDAPLADGPVRFAATVRDGDGNLSTPAVVDATIFTGAPSVAFTLPAPGDLVPTATPSVSLAYTANADPTTLVVSSAPTAVAWDCTTTATDAVCTATAPLPDGGVQLTARVSDGGGQAATPATLDLVVDTLEPTLTILQPADGATVFSATPSLEVSYDDAGAGVDPGSLAFTLDGAPLAADCTPAAGTASCVPSAPIADGGHSLTARVSDFAGRESAPASVQLTVDTSDVTPPDITVSQPLDGSATNSGQVVIVGALDETASLTIDGTPVSVEPDLTFSQGPVAVGEGPQRITLTATDPSGNVGTASLTVIGDTAPPVAVFLAPVDGSYFDPAVDPIRLRWGDLGAGVDTGSLELAADGTPINANCTVCTDGAECVALDPFPTSVVTLTVRVADRAGNLSAVAQARFSSDPGADLTAPVIDLASPLDGSSQNDPQVVFSGRLSEAATLTLDGDPVALDAANGFRHDPVTLTEGANAFSLRAVDAAGNATTRLVTVTLDTTPPSPVDTALVTVGAPVGGSSSVTGAPGAVSGVEAGLAVHVTDVATGSTQVAAVAGDGGFSTSVLAYGGDTLRFSVADAAGNRSVARYLVVPGSAALPPAPSAVAPLLDRSVATSLCTATRYLYTGANPIQAGVDPADVDCALVARLSGRVRDRAGAPIPGVRVSVQGRPELGTTLSRADGAFDLVVHGGAPLLISYWKEGLLPAHRTVAVAALATATAPDVVLIPLDPVSTLVDLTSSAPIQTARGGVVTDADGTRQATLLFPQGTAATARSGDGAGRPLTSLTVRATEYTVGDDGFEAMPADLPVGTSYTYAVELSVDEAGPGESVEFSQPVPVYLENFLAFPVGTPVPAGWYDRDQGRWLAAPDGRVVAVLGVDAGGLAELDLDGSGTAADATALAALGVSDDERRELASLYTAGQSLWRVPVEHFTPWDYNWWADLAREKERRRAAQERRRKMWENVAADWAKICDDAATGSIIECSNQILGERLEIGGIDQTLTYWSDRVPGRKAARSIRIPLSGDTLPLGLVRIELEVEAAGQLESLTFPAQANLDHTFTWSGRDAEGRTLQGQTTATIRVGYVYDDGVYQAPPANCTSCFAQGGVAPIGPNNARQESTQWSTLRVPLGYWDARQLGLGGWTLAQHHAYDPTAQMLYRGDGGRRRVRGMEVTTTVSGPDRPAELTVDADGTAYYIDRSQPIPKVWAVQPDGTRELILGDPDFPGLVDIAVDPRDGGIFLLDTGRDTGDPCLSPAEGCADQHNTVIWKLYPHFGKMIPLYSDPLGPHVSAPYRTLTNIWDPIAIALDRSGTPYVANGSTYAHFFNPVSGEPESDPREINIWRVHPFGTDVFLAGNLNVDPETLDLYFAEHELNNYGAAQDHVNKMRFDAQNNLYFTVSGVCSAVLVRAPTGLVDILAGSATGGNCSGFSGDGGSGTLAKLSSPEGIAIRGDTDVYVADVGNNRVRRISLLDGTIETWWGTGETTDTGDAKLGQRTNLFAPTGLAATPDGGLLVSDTNHGKLRKLGSPLPTVSVTGFRVPSADGSEVYVFDAEGRHLETQDPVSGGTVASFEYAPFGERRLLQRIVDQHGNATEIERDGSGEPTAITAPFGQRTTLSIGIDGYLATMIDELGGRTELSYGTDGLLETLRNPRGLATTFIYGPLGRLLRDTDPEGGYTELTRTTSGAVTTVTKSSAEGYATTFVTERRIDGSESTTTAYPDGSTSVRTRSRDGRTVARYRDGTTIETVVDPDPRFGMLAPILSQGTVRTPGGRESVTVTDRQVTQEAGVAVRVQDSVAVDGLATVSVNDLAQRTIDLTSPAGRSSAMSYDTLGRVTEIREPGSLPIAISYDPQGRLKQTTQGTRVVTYSYNARGLLESASDALGPTGSLEYDLLGRVTKSVLRDGREVLYGYDENSNLTSVTPPIRPSHQYTYNGADAMQDYSAPDLGVPRTTTIAYNLDHQPVLVTRPHGRTIQVVYDPVSGRVSSVTSDSGTQSVTYDPQSGAVASLTTPEGNSLSFTYDGSLVTSVTQGGGIAGAVSWAYDDRFQPVEEIVNGAPPVTFTYDDDGLPTRAGVMTLSYDGQSGLLFGSQVGGVVDTLARSAYAEVTGYSASFQGNDVYAVQLTRNATGRIVGKVETVAGITDNYSYGYDATLRLIQVERNGSVVESYSYDDNGNRLMATDGWGTHAGSYDDQDRLLSYGDVSYTYTANGELATKTQGGQSNGYQYDVFGNLRQVDLASGLTIEYVIGPTDRRIGKKVNGSLTRGFLYGADANLVAELDAAGNVVSTFTYGSRSHTPDYMERGGVTYRIIRDVQGSPRLVVDVATGAVAQRLDYSAFGRVTLDTNPGFQPFGYAGGLYDPQTGLLRFGARDYDPETGRWLSKDPIRFAGGDTNLYGYALNDPINFTDRDGLSSDEVAAFTEGFLEGLFWSATTSVVYLGAVALSGPFAPVVAVLGTVYTVNGWVGAGASALDMLPGLLVGDPCVSSVDRAYEWGNLAGGRRLGRGTGFKGKPFSPSPASRVSKTLRPGHVGRSPRGMKYDWQKNLHVPEQNGLSKPPPPRGWTETEGGVYVPQGPGGWKRSEGSGLLLAP